jgi:hypothetical protein
MHRGHVIRKQLSGTSSEQARREELLQALLEAFAMGGSEAVATELENRLKVLEGAFDAKLQALNILLS